MFLLSLAVVPEQQQTAAAVVMATAGDQMAAPVLSSYGIGFRK